MVHWAQVSCDPADLLEGILPSGWWEPLCSFGEGVRPESWFPYLNLWISTLCSPPTPKGSSPHCALCCLVMPRARLALQLTASQLEQLVKATWH